MFENGTLWMYVGIFAAAVAATFLVLLLYNARERLRYESHETERVFAEWGLTDVADFFGAHAVGDLSGMIRVSRKLLTKIKGFGLPELFKDAFRKLLAHFAQDVSWRQEIRQACDAAESTARAKLQAAVEQLKTVGT